MQEKCRISADTVVGLRDPAARREAFDRVAGHFLRPLCWHVRRLVVKLLESRGAVLGA